MSSILSSHQRDHDNIMYLLEFEHLYAKFDQNWFTERLIIKKSSNSVHKSWNNRIAYTQKEKN